jgi:hypothetical protein
MRAISGPADRPAVGDHGRNGSACLIVAKGSPTSRERVKYFGHGDVAVMAAGIGEVQNWSSHRSTG